MNQTSSGTQTPQSFDGDNITLGIILMLSFCLVIPFADALMKLLSGSVPVLTLAIIRYFLQIVLTVPIMLWHKRGISHLLTLSKATWWRLFGRTAMHIVGIVGMYFGLKHLPLADTVAIVFVFPLFMLLAGYFFLGEQVGYHRFGAVIVGFAGTLMVVQPNFISAGLNVLWPIAVALTFVFFNLVTRQMSREIDPVSIQVVTGFMAVILLAIPIWLLNGEPYRFFDLIMPKADEWPLLLGVGIAGTFGHLLMTAALRYAPSTTLAPMQYLEIPFAAAIGWIVFSDWPNWLATIGIMVTISSGLYIVYRERKTSRKV